MDLSQLNELDFNNIGEWPILAKIGAVVILAVVIIGAVIYIDTQNQWDALAQAQADEQKLRKSFEDKQQKASSLDGYRQQLAEMKESFGSMLKQLPDKTEVASLLVEVSQTGLATGLDFELFRPGAEVPKDFYAELPIAIRVIGGFHEFGNFVSGLAALPRIVTIHDVNITPQNAAAKPNDKSSDLVLEATAKTYRYLEEGSK